MFARVPVCVQLHLWIIFWCSLHFDLIIISLQQKILMNSTQFPQMNKTKQIKVTRFVPRCSGHDLKDGQVWLKQFTPGMVFVFKCWPFLSSPKSVPSSVCLSPGFTWFIPLIIKAQSTLFDKLVAWQQIDYVVCATCWVFKFFSGKNIIGRTEVLSKLSFTCACFNVNWVVTMINVPLKTTCTVWNYDFKGWHF